MADLSQKTLVLFFTISVSLKKWQKIGSLDREIKPYNLLAGKFNKIYFVTYGAKDRELKNVLAKNIEILPKKISFLPDVIYSLLIPFLYKKELKEADIYKTNQMLASPSAVISKWLYKKKLVVRCGYEWFSFLLKRDSFKNIARRPIGYFLERISYKSADAIILTSERDKEFIVKKFKIPSFKITVNPNYIDTNLFKPLDLPKEKNRICFVGGLSFPKNPENLLKAIDGLDVKLVLFGKEETQGKIKELAGIVKKAKIEFRGNIPNEKLPEELNKSEIFILPSFYEGNPKALLEAMSCGVPCIGTNVDGIKEVIKHKENGFLCFPNSESIRSAILEVLSDKTLQKKMGENGHRTIMEGFDLNSILSREIRIYESL